MMWFLWLIGLGLDPLFAVRPEHVQRTRLVLAHNTNGLWY
jgi:hypothetical protein